MCLAYNRKNNSQINFALLLLVLFIIIITIAGRVSAQEENKRDPFLSLGDEIKLSQKNKSVYTLPYPIVLNGIIWTEKIAIAVINDEIVQEGEYWRELKLEKVEKDRVIIQWGENLFEIPLILEEDAAKAKKD